MNNQDFVEEAYSRLFERFAKIMPNPDSWEIFPAIKKELTLAMEEGEKKAHSEMVSGEEIADSQKVAFMLGEAAGRNSAVEYIKDNVVARDDGIICATPYDLEQALQASNE